MNYYTVISVEDGTSRLVVPADHTPVGKRAGDGPAWSPDGRQIAFASRGSLHVMPVGPAGDATGPSRQLTRELADSISWAGPSEILYIATVELAAYVAAGFTPFQALQTATVNTANLLNVQNDLGTIEKGKLADMVVVEGNPLANIADAARVRTVIKNGEVFTLEQLLDVPQSPRPSQVDRAP